MTPRCISGSVPPRHKIPKVIPMFSRLSFSTVPMLNLFGDSFTPKFIDISEIFSAFSAHIYSGKVTKAFVTILSGFRATG